MVNVKGKRESKGKERESIDEMLFGDGDELDLREVVSKAVDDLAVEMYST